MCCRIGSSPGVIAYIVGRLHLALRQGIGLCIIQTLRIAFCIPKGQESGIFLPLLLFLPLNLLFGSPSEKQVVAQLKYYRLCPSLGHVETYGSYTKSSDVLSK